MGFFKDIIKKPLGAIGAAVGLPFVGSTMLAGLGSYLDYQSARDQNASAEAMARAQMEFSAGQAQKQMDFQERMAGSAHQREVADLKAAGLNPLLSVNSGAPSPGGAMGSGSVAPVVPELGAISASVKDAMRMWNEYRSTDAQVELSKANTIKTGVDTDLLRKRGPAAEVDERFYKFINDILDRYGKYSARSKGPMDLLGPPSAEEDAYLSLPWYKRLWKEYPGTGFDK